MKEILPGLVPAIYLIYTMYIIKLYSDQSILTHYALDNSLKMDQNLVWRKSWCDEDVCAAVVVVVGGGGGG